VARTLPGADGGVVSPVGGGHAAVEPVIVEVAERLPAASKALTPNVRLRPQGSPLYVVVVCVVVPVRLPSR
jgi:hypothetical protein